MHGKRVFFPGWRGPERDGKARIGEGSGKERVYSRPRERETARCMHVVSDLLLLSLASLFSLSRSYARTRISGRAERSEKCLEWELRVAE